VGTQTLPGISKTPPDSLVLLFFIFWLRQQKTALEQQIYVFLVFKSQMNFGLSDNTQYQMMLFIYITLHKPPRHNILNVG